MVGAPSACAGIQSGLRGAGWRGDWNDTLVLSVQAGSHWSPREQGSSGVSALPLPGMFVAYVWLESGVSTERESCLLQRSHSSREESGRVFLALLVETSLLVPPHLTPKITSNGSKRKAWRGASSLVWRAMGTYKQNPLGWPPVSSHNTSPYPP